MSAEEKERRSLGVSSLAHTFRAWDNRQGTAASFKALRAWAERLEPPLVLCWGDYGNGKTHLLEAAIIRLRERGIYARLTVWARLRGILLEKIKARDASPSYEQVLMNYCTAPVIVLDDYGMGTLDTAWERSVLEQLVNHRYHNRLPLAMTTNMSPDDLPERVKSRFGEDGVGVIVENKGGDYRRS